MNKKIPQRQTVELSNYPKMVVIYLGMRVNAWVGLKTLLGFGPKIAKSVANKPDGLLLHEDIMFSLFPLHIGMRQYWRDFDALETWARSEPHKIWWKEFLQNSQGTGFWHEAYFMEGGMEAVYINIPKHIGFLSFAPSLEARNSMFSARQRAHRPDSPTLEAPVREQEVYQENTK